MHLATQDAHLLNFNQNKLKIQKKKIWKLNNKNSVDDLVENADILKVK
jgi:hypothetical protein